MRNFPAKSISLSTFYQQIHSFVPFIQYVPTAKSCITVCNIQVYNYSFETIECFSTKYENSDLVQN